MLVLKQVVLRIGFNNAQIYTLKTRIKKKEVKNAQVITRAFTILITVNIKVAIHAARPSKCAGSHRAKKRHSLRRQLMQSENAAQGRQDQALTPVVIAILLAQCEQARADEANVTAYALHDQLASKRCWPKRLIARPPGGFIRFFYFIFILFQYLT